MSLEHMKKIKTEYITNQVETMAVILDICDYRFRELGYSNDEITKIATTIYKTNFHNL